MVTHAPGVSRREVLLLAAGVPIAGCTGLSSSGQAGTTGQANQQSPTETGTEDDQAESTTGETVRAFVGSYHWGYFVLDADGTERDQLSLTNGDELRLTLFSVEADDAVAALPQAVRNGIPDSAERARRNEQSIPTPQGTSLETLHEAAEAAYPDHSLALVSDEFLRPGGPGQGGPGQGGPGQGPRQGPQGSWAGHHGPHGGPSGPYGPGSGQGGGGMYGPGSGGGGCWGPAFGTLAPTTYLWHHSTVPAELGFVVDTAGSFGFACTVYCGYGHPYMAEPGRVVVSEE
ncbi:hypothetical protein [Haloarcula marina]|uniref:hypothetical protein n=1 Tax=Haloarcula marina TaxID=2961574 RepID=UPI0020B890FE|nr:hypothetical protein [Halomicroarcula marina]